MSTQHARPFSRRRFLSGVTLAGTAGLLGWHPRQAAAEPPPETTTLRLGQAVAGCQAPQYVAEALLRAEGFTEVQYVSVTELKTKFGTKNVVEAYGKGLLSGALDLSLYFVASEIVQLDEGYPVALLGGVHTGCYE